MEMKDFGKNINKYNVEYIFWHWFEIT